MSFSGHCLNFRCKCNSTSLLNECNSTRMKSPQKLQPSLQKKYILTSSVVVVQALFLLWYSYNLRICNGCRGGRDPGSGVVPRFFGSTSPYLPGPNPPAPLRSPSASSFALSGWRAPNKCPLSSTHCTMRKKPMAFLRLRFGKVNSKASNFQLGTWKPGVVFIIIHHLESIYPQLMLQSQECAAEFEIKKPSHQSDDNIHWS